MHRKKCTTTLTSFLGLFASTVCSRYFTDDLFKIFRQMLGKMDNGGKNHINDTLVTSKRCPRPLLINRGAR